MTLIELIIWAIAIYGTANGIAFSTLLMPLRLYFQYSSWTQDPTGQITGVKRTDKYMLKIASLLSCPMCIGFWAGVFFSLIWKSPSGGNYIVDAFAGSGTAWLIYLMTAFRQNGH